MPTYFEDYEERLLSFHEQMKGYLADLPDEATDWVPGEEMSSVAVLIVHTMGSEAYWVGQMAAEVDANRTRATEFETPHNLSIAELTALLDAGTENCKAWLAPLTLADLPKMIHSPAHDREFSIGWSLLHALDHIAEHTGHLGMTKQLWEKRDS